jgi:hypothetical protein
LRVQYVAEKDLDAAAQQVLAKAIGDRLGLQQLEIVAEREPPPQPETPAKASRKR